jgi:hypothetical protein
MWEAVALTAMLGLVARSAVAQCVGDCDGNGKVPISEAQRCVNIRTGAQALTACQNADQNLDGTVSEAEVDACIQSFLDPANCRDVFTPVSTNTPTITRTLPPTATRTPTLTATETATVTLTPEMTATATVTPTDTLTVTQTPTNTPTPSPTTPATAELGTRIFSVGTYSAAGKDTRSNFLTTAALAFYPTMPNLSAGFAPGPLKLVAGAAGPDGKAPLSLGEDAIYAQRTAVGGYIVCFKLLAQGSEGYLRCGEGPRPDLTLTEQTGKGVPPGTVTISDGPPVTGGAWLKVTQRSVTLNPPATFNSCLTTTDWDAGITAYYSTGKATAVKGTMTIIQQGESFTCDTWTVEDTAGMLVVPMVSYTDKPVLVGDTANVLRIADVSTPPPATPTRTPTVTRTPT